MTLKVNIGCGSDIRPGWLNIDANYASTKENYLEWDLNQGLPQLCDGMELLYSSHVVEHLTPEVNLRILKDAYQMLAVGGEVYYEIPDFKSAIRAYLNEDWEYCNDPAILAFAPNKLYSEILDYSLHQRDNAGNPEHICFLDAERMCLWFKQAGFRTYGQVSFNPTIGNPNPLRKKYSVYVSAIKD